MKSQHILVKICLFTGLFLVTTNVFPQNPNFYIFLCFGQSNMEGQGAIELQDRTVDNRFQVLQAVDCSNLGRTKGSWYPAVPPLTRCYNGLSPADYFGRTLAANLPDSITVGIINVSVAGCKIELYDKDDYQDYIATITESWLLDIINAYDGNPYGYLVDLARQAQEDGVIKGILLHQGESNTGDTQWPIKVKGVYDSLIVDLELDPDSVPLLAGEVVHADQGGVCASMNAIIATLPDTVPNSYVISSSGCTAASDNLHFNSSGYRELGRRYAATMLSLLGYELNYGRGTESINLEAECATVGDSWRILADATASNGSYVTITSGLESIEEAPANSAGAVYFPFEVETVGNYSVYARSRCPSANDDSYWIKIDDGAFELVDGLASSGWQWVTLTHTELTADEHTLTIAYREDGAKLDKINISDYLYAPSEMGGEAENVCEPVISPSGLNQFTISDGYHLGQNHPNPFHENSTIPFEIPSDTYVSLKVYNMLGVEIAELGGRKYSQGEHAEEFNAQNLSEGIYFYTLKADRFSANRRMIIQTE